MHKTLASLILCLILTSGVQAVAADPACYKNEIDQSTRKVYQSQQQYESDLAELYSHEPPHPGYPRLYRAYKVYKDAMATQKRFKSDKQAHCFIGCRIAGEVDAETAIYVAWYKEERDLKDCNIQTHFEWADIKATLKGVDIAVGRPDADDYPSLCRKRCR